MNVFYEGADITSDIDIEGAVAGDYEGGRADDLSLKLADVEALWTRWAPKQGDTLRVTEGEYDSGILYLDDFRFGPTACQLWAASIRCSSREVSFQTWENITLRQLIQDFAKRYELELSLHDLPDVSYARVAQYGNVDLQWLAHRCALEGCALKLHDAKLVVYDQQKAEQGASVRAIELTNNTDYEYRELGHLRRSACVVESGSIRGKFIAPAPAVGPTMYIGNLSASSIAEAQRFARGALREQNKRAPTLTVRQELDGAHVAGVCVDVTGNVAAEGRWFVSSVRNDFVRGTALLELRRPLQW